MARYRVWLPITAPPSSLEPQSRSATRRRIFLEIPRLDSGGEFTLRDIPPGVYNVTINKQGFKRAEYPDVQVNVGTNQEIRATLRSVRLRRRLR